MEKDKDFRTGRTYGKIEDVKVTAENWGKSKSEYYAGHSNLEHLDYVNDNVIEFAEMTYKMLELYSKKDRDYGDSFNHSLDEDGLLVAKIRLGDKISRFNSLLKRGEVLVDDESIVDTLIDIANYSVMTIMWINRNDESLNVYSDGKVVAKIDPDFQFTIEGSRKTQK